MPATTNSSPAAALAHAAQRRAARIWFYAVVIALVAGVWSVQRYAYDKIFSKTNQILFSAPSDASSPNGWQAMSVQAMTDTNALLTTLATALLGAIGLLMVNSRTPLRSRHRWAAFLAAISGGVSLYFGYMSHLNLLGMINIQGFVAPYTSVYQFSSHAQFYTLLAGAFFCADFAFHDIGKEDPQ
jgi:hypothetical protein